VLLERVARQIRATLLLGIEGLAVEQVTLKEDGARVALVVTADEARRRARRAGWSRFR
jgi:hypothetical protein